MSSKGHAYGNLNNDKDGYPDHNAVSHPVQTTKMHLLTEPILISLFSSTTKEWIVYEAMQLVYHRDGIRFFVSGAICDWFAAGEMEGSWVGDADVACAYCVVFQ